MKKLQTLVLEWATEKGILDNPNPMKQAIKTSEEVLELQNAILDNNEKEIKDAIGDIIVTLMIQCKMQRIDFMKIYEENKDVILERYKDAYRDSLLLEKETSRIKFFIIKDVSYVEYLIEWSFLHLQTISHLLNCNIEECLQLAYNEIKDRTGRMVNGTFVKDK